jgi:hypothetical protein
MTNAPDYSKTTNAAYQTPIGHPMIYTATELLTKKNPPTKAATLVGR